MDEEHFRALLDLNPADWDTRLVYADWLLDRGRDVLAQGQRWMGLNKRHSARRDFPPLFIYDVEKLPHDRPIWEWYGPLFKPNGFYTLPARVFDALDKSNWISSEKLKKFFIDDFWPHQAGFSSRALAELAVARALEATFTVSGKRSGP